MIILIVTALLLAVLSLVLLFKYELDVRASSFILFVSIIFYAIYILFGNRPEVYLNFLILIVLSIDRLISVFPLLDKKNSLRALTRYSNNYPLIAFETIYNIPLNTYFRFTPKTNGIKTVQGDGMCSFSCDCLEKDKLDKYFIHDFYKEIEIESGELIIETKDIYGFSIETIYKEGNVAQIHSYIPHKLKVETGCKMTVLCIKKLY